MQFSRVLCHRVFGGHIRQSLHKQLSPSSRFSAVEAARGFPSLRSPYNLPVADFRTIATAHAIKLPRFRNRRLICSQNQVKVPSSVQKASNRDVLLSPPALVITREYEWANIIIGFEQANKYTIRAAPGGEVVGFLAEETNFGSTISRNVMRTRRPFKATIFDKNGDILFNIRRPLFLVSPSIFVESEQGERLGEVHMSWHLWRRRYDLFVDKSQFASVDSGFLAVDFDMRDVEGKKIASVNKDFTGFAREIFTDARQYVLRLDPSFGLSSDGILVRDASTVHVSDEVYSEVQLGLRERAVVLATAVAIDFDYFSIHSRGHMHPGLMMMPGGGSQPPASGPAGVPPGAGAGGAGAAVGADVLSNELDGDEEAGGHDPYGANSMNEGIDEPNTLRDGDPDPYETVVSNEDSTSSDSDWATFEEPDYGFTEEPTEHGEEDVDSFGFGNESSNDDQSSGGLFGILSDIFGNNDS